MNALDIFNHRVVSEWLPTFCNDPKRNYCPDGFRMKPNELSEKDAHDFMRAVDEKVVSVDAGGRFRMPQSKALEVIFWDGASKASPRGISLWIEPIVTIAAMARLHFDYGWPLKCLGMQSNNWAFDIMAYHPADTESPCIAGEVKSNRKQLDQLMNNLRSCCARGNHDCLTAPTTTRNAHKKWAGLRLQKPPLFWALGPGNDSRLFKVSYDSDFAVLLTETDNSLLSFFGATET